MSSSMNGPTTLVSSSRLLAPLSAMVALRGETGNKLLARALLAALFLAGLYLSYRGFV